ncbi:MAG: hypothetical protein ACYCPM_03885 [Acidobacteriaceae bacterium]
MNRAHHECIFKNLDPDRRLQSTSKERYRTDALRAVRIKSSKSFFHGELVTKLPAYVLFFSLAIAMPIVAHAAANPVQRASRTSPSKSRKAYVKNQKKQKKKLRKAQKKLQKQMKKSHKMAH